MSINQGPNSQIDVDKFSTGVKTIFNAVDNPSIYNMMGTPGAELKRKQSELLREMVNDLNKPILKSLATDMLSVMIQWLDDPKVLCCLIQGIFAAYIAKNGKTDLGKFLTRNHALADSDFGKFLDKMITFLDFVIILLTQDLKKIIFFIPDIIKEMYDLIMGSILLIIQETVYALRDSILEVIFQWVDEKANELTWSKCLPLKQMIDILKKYINDYGILADILNKIKGFVSGLRFKFDNISKTLVPNIKDLEFLYWLRDLLVKLKRATLNFDLCVDYEFVPAVAPPGGVIIADNLNQVSLERMDNPVQNSEVGAIRNNQGYTLGADGSILVDRDKAVGNWVPRISNSFLRDFIHKEYNIPYEIIDNTITRGTSGDHIQGTSITSENNTILDRCANTPNADEALNWILNIRNRLT